VDEINKSFSAEDMLKQAEDELAATGGTETGPEEEGGRMRPMQILPKIKNIPIETGMSSIRTQAMRTR